MITLIISYFIFYSVWITMGSVRVCILGGPEVGKTAFIITLNEILTRKNEGGPADLSTSAYVLQVREKALKEKTKFWLTEDMRTFVGTEPLRLKVGKVKFLGKETKVNIVISARDIHGGSFDAFNKDFMRFARHRDMREVSMGEIERFLKEQESVEQREVYRKILETISQVDVLIAIIDPTRYLQEKKEGMEVIHKAINEQFVGLSMAVLIAAGLSKKRGWKIFGKVKIKGIIVVFNKKDIHKMSRERVNEIFAKAFPQINSWATEYNIPIRIHTSTCAGWDLYNSVDKIEEETGVRKIFLDLIAMLRPSLM